MLHKPHFKHPGATNVAGVSNNMSSGYQTWKEMFLLENFCKSVFLKLINNFTCFNVWASLVAQIVKNLSAMQETQVDAWVWKIPWRREWQPTPVILSTAFYGQRSLVGYIQFMGSLHFMESDDWVTNTFITKIQIIFKSIKSRTIFEKKNPGLANSRENGDNNIH